MKDFFRKEKLIQLGISIALALLLWVVSISNINPSVEKSFSDIPINLLNKDVLTSKELTLDNFDGTVYVRLRGQNSHFLRFKKNDIKATIDLAQINEPGNHSLNIEIDGLPDQVSLVEKSPDTILVEVSKIVKKSSNFTITRSGTPSAGFEVLSMKSDTTVVELSGSSSSISRIKEIKGNIDLTDVNSDFTSQVVLSAYDEDGNTIEGVEIIPAYVEMNILVSKFKTVPIRTEIIGECASGYFVISTEIAPVEVRIAASEADLDKLSFVSLNSIDISGRSESFTATGTLNLPPNVTLLSPEDIVVKIKIAQIESKTFTLTNSIQVINTPPGLKCSPVRFDNITVTVISEPGGLENITSDDIKLSVDLAGLSAGVYEMEIKFELPKDVFLKDTSRNKVTVTLSEP